VNAGARKLLTAAAQPEEKLPDPVTAPPEAKPPPPKAASKPISAVDAAVTEAYASGRRDKFARAAEALEDSLRRAPGNLVRRKSLAFIYLEKLHSPKQAVPHLEKVVAAAPDDGSWLQMLARAQAASGDKSAAAVTYRRAAEASPRDVWTRYHLGCTLRDLNRKAEAEAAFRQALKLDPKNKYVRRELARAVQASGRTREAAEIARELVREDERDAESHAMLGDIYRSGNDFAAAGTEYQAALASDPAHPIATAGIQELRKQQRTQAKLAFYTFEDTDDLRQTGVFSHVSFFLNSRLQGSVFLNERWFKRPPDETAERFEAGLGLDYRFNGVVQVSAGVSQFKTENLDRETGANIAVYVAPASWVDAWASYRYAEAVNDSYITASEAFTQDILSAGLNLRPFKNVVASVTASTAEYSDGNTRRSALASIGWYVPVVTSPVLRLEYEWLDFDERTPDYSSPENYGRLRPVFELTPKITDWLALEVHGELDYVFDESEWGYGVTVGPRMYAGDWLNVGFMYMKYEIPGGQTTWSGEGFKVDLTYRF
jgi:Flp pilus assembly protein TadD